MRPHLCAHKPRLCPPQSWRIRRARCLASSGKAGLSRSSGKQQRATTCKRMIVRRTRLHGEVKRAKTFNLESVCLFLELYFNYIYAHTYLYQSIYLYHFIYSSSSSPNLMLEKHLLQKLSAQKFIFKPLALLLDVAIALRCMIYSNCSSPDAQT